MCLGVSENSVVFKFILNAEQNKSDLYDCTKFIWICVYAEQFAVFCQLVETSPWKEQSSRRGEIERDNWERESFLVFST